MADGTEEKDGETPETEPEAPLAEEALEEFAEVRKAIAEDRLEDAESLLENFEERGAEWYYQRAMLCRKKNWYLESYRNMKEALNLDPENEHYQEVLEELNKMAGIEDEEGVKRKKRKKHMGSKGYPGTCGEACVNSCGDGCGECCAELCCVGSCQCLCEGLGSGC